MSNNENPYRAPQSNLENAAEASIVLVSRGARLGAYIIDLIVILAAYLPMLFFTGYFDGAMDDNWSPSITQEIISTIFVIVIFLIINGHLLSKYGQTVGKRVLGISIRDMQGNLCPFVPMVLKRYVLWVAVEAIPISGGFIALADTLMIFRQDRRCLHDLVAGTQVINVKQTI